MRKIAFLVFALISWLIVCPVQNEKATAQAGQYSLTGTWIARGTGFTGDNKGCSSGLSGRLTVNGQDTAPGYEFTMTQQGNQITSPPQNVSYSNSTGSGSYTQSSNGTVSGKQVTSTSSGGGFTTKCEGTISNEGNTVTGQCSCQYSGGPAIATGSFTWERKEEILYQTL